MTGLVVVLQFAVDEPDFERDAEVALRALAARPGYLGGSVGRSTDDEGAWVIECRWADVGSYRRALGSYDVKLNATPLLARATDLPSAFEALVSVEGDGTAALRASDRAR